MVDTKEVKQLKKEVEALKKELQDLKAQLKGKEIDLRGAGTGSDSLKKDSKHKLEKPKDEGVTGTFDGKFMLSTDGKKYEVPENYAVKSRILYGDEMKMEQREDKNFFKVTGKQKKKKVEGILTKKEGEWSVLTTYGSYNISQTAAEYNDLNIGSEVIVIVPEDNTNVPYAAFDKVVVSQKSSNSTKDTSKKSSASSKESTKAPITSDKKQEVVVDSANPNKKPAPQKSKQEEPEKSETNEKVEQKQDKDKSLSDSSETAKSDYDPRRVEDFDLR